MISDDDDSQNGKNGNSATNGGGSAGDSSQAWLPDGYGLIVRLYAFGPSGLKNYGSAILRCKI